MNRLISDISTTAPSKVRTRAAAFHNREVLECGVKTLFELAVTH
jgi:hypothetical protein